MHIKTSSRTIIIVCLAWIVLVTMMCFSCASANNLPTSEANDDSPTFVDMDSAARYALSNIGRTHDSEFGGSLVRCARRDGTVLVATSATTQGLELSVSFNTSVPRSWRLCEIIGRYHSHPTNAPYGEYFSPGDIQTAESEKLPVYLLVSKTGQMKVFRPGKSPKTFLKISGHLVRVSLGELL